MFRTVFHCCNCRRRGLRGEGGCSRSTPASWWMSPGSTVGTPGSHPIGFGASEEITPRYPRAHLHRRSRNRPRITVKGTRPAPRSVVGLYRCTPPLKRATAALCYCNRHCLLPDSSAAQLMIEPSRVTPRGQTSICQLLRSNAIRTLQSLWIRTSRSRPVVQCLFSPRSNCSESGPKIEKVRGKPGAFIAVLSRGELKPDGA
jgi:hypothetical protein